MKKKLIIAGLVLFLISALLLFLAFRNFQEEIPGGQITSENTVTQTRERIFFGDITADVNITSKPDLPSSLPFYEYITPTATIKDYENLIQRAGFSISEAEYQDHYVLGKEYQFYGSRAYLLINTDQMKIDYQTGIDVTGNISNINEDAYISAATDFLVENFIVSDVNELKNAKVQRINAEEFINPVGSSNLVRVSFNKTTPNGHPVIPSTYSDEVYEVYINNRQQVVNLSVDDYPEVREGTLVKLKTYDEAIASISEADVKSVGNGSVDLYFLSSESLKNVNVTGISIAYLQGNGKDSAILEPVYILTGNVFLDEEFGTQSVELVLPAIIN